MGLINPHIYLPCRLVFVCVLNVRVWVQLLRPAGAPISMAVMLQAVNDEVFACAWRFRADLVVCIHLLSRDEIHSNTVRLKTS